MSDYNQDTHISQEPQGNMPNKGLYTFWLVIGFLSGILWGVLSIRHYTNMNQAIKDNNPYEAWDCAKKVRMFALIGIGVNALLLIVRLAGSR